MKAKPIRIGYRVIMIMLTSGTPVNYYEGDLPMCMAIAESLRRGKTGGRVVETPSGRVLAEWNPDSTEIRKIQ